MHEFEKPVDESIIEKSLLGLPSHRVGYSDRTGWLMATMSQLAYFEFENKSTIAEIAEDLAKLAGKEEISQYLQNIVGALDKGGKNDRRDFLASILGVAGFELVEIFDAGSTQAFLARRDTADQKAKMLVLAFRGTEKKLADWKADIKAKLVPARDQKRIGRIHQGFQDAYYGVEDSIEKNGAYPYYLTISRSAVVVGSVQQQGSRQRLRRCARQVKYRLHSRVPLAS